MKFKKIVKPLITSCLLPLAFGATANALGTVSSDAMEYNFVDIKGGLVQPTKMTGNSNLTTANTTYTAGLEVGRKFMATYGLSLEYSHRGPSTAGNNDAGGTQYNNWKVQSDTLMVNMTADLLKDTGIKPYAKLGFGASRNKAGDYIATLDNSRYPVSTATWSGKTSSSFAWQAGVGLTMPTHPMFDTKVEYVFINRGQAKTKENFTSSDTGKKMTAPARTGKLQDHVFTIGFRVKF